MFCSSVSLLELLFYSVFLLKIFCCSAILQERFRYSAILLFLPEPFVILLELLFYSVFLLELFCYFASFLERFRYSAILIFCWNLLAFCYSASLLNSFLYSAICVVVLICHSVRIFLTYCLSAGVVLLSCYFERSFCLSAILLFCLSSILLFYWNCYIILPFCWSYSCDKNTFR